MRAERLQQGSFRYRTIVDGRQAGTSTIEVRKRAGSATWEFSNRITGAFSQDWLAIATDSFAPISARLRFGEGDEARTAFELSYADGRVRGLAFSRQPPYSSRPVDEPVTADTVDQRIDWAAVMSLPEYAAGDEWTFRVYDPGTGLSRIRVAIGGVEKLDVPAGSFEAVRLVYTIDKNRGAEKYEAFIRRLVPRFLLRERFPNGSLTELVEIAP